MFYVYVLKSKKDNKYYTGSTGDLRKRFKEHNNNKVSSTKGRAPLELIYYEACLNEKDARIREKYLKSGMGKRYLKNRIKCFLSLTGFTLIELMVAIGIITLLSSISIFYSRIGESQLILAKEEAGVFGLIIRAKTLSVATFGGAGSPCGYGVHFEGNSAILFKELSPSDDSKCQDINFVYSSDEKFQELKLNSAVAFSFLGLQDVVFIPPQPVIIIDGDENKAEGIIKIKTIDGKNEKSIKITNGGQITD